MILIVIFSDKDDLSKENNFENVQVSYIDKAFNNRRTFTCPLLKSLFVTGTNGGNITPEDIDIVGAMGDALSVPFNIF